MGRPGLQSFYNQWVSTIAKATGRTPSIPAYRKLRPDAARIDLPITPFSAVSVWELRPETYDPSAMHLSSTGIRELSDHVDTVRIVLRSAKYAAAISQIFKYITALLPAKPGQGVSLNSLDRYTDEIGPVEDLFGNT